jgi:hypothetical protein
MARTNYKAIAAFKAFSEARGTNALFTRPVVDVTGCAPRESKRVSPTTPPPANNDLALGMEAEAAEQERIGRSCLARAEELRSAARSARRVAKLTSK